MFEYTKKENLMKLSPDARTFIAKKIMQEVDLIAKEKDIPQEKAYAMYASGLYGGDRIVD